MNTTSATNMKTHTTSVRLFITQLAALLLMIAGWAWLSGNFAQPQEPLAADILTDFLHALPGILVVIFGLRYFGALYSALLRGDGTVGGRGAYIGITVVAIFGAAVLILGGLILSLTGVTNSNPNSVGIHTLDDAIPAVLLISGSLLWLVMAFLARRR